MGFKKVYTLSGDIYKTVTVDDIEYLLTLGSIFEEGPLTDAYPQFFEDCENVSVNENSSFSSAPITSLYNTQKQKKRNIYTSTIENNTGVVSPISLDVIKNDAPNNTSTTPTSNSIEDLNIPYESESINLDLFTIYNKNRHNNNILYPSPSGIHTDYNIEIVTNDNTTKFIKSEYDVDNMDITVIKSTREDLILSSDGIKIHHSNNISKKGISFDYTNTIDEKRRNITYLDIFTVDGNITKSSIENYIFSDNFENVDITTITSNFITLTSKGIFITPDGIYDYIKIGKHRNSSNITYLIEKDYIYKKIKEISNLITPLNFELNYRHINISVADAIISKLYKGRLSYNTNILLRYSLVVDSKLDIFRKSTKSNRNIHFMYYRYITSDIYKKNNKDYKIIVTDVFNKDTIINDRITTNNGKVTKINNLTLNIFDTFRFGRMSDFIVVRDIKNKSLFELNGNIVTTNDRRKVQIDDFIILTNEENIKLNLSSFNIMYTNSILQKYIGMISNRIYHKQNKSDIDVNTYVITSNKEKINIVEEVIDIFDNSIKLVNISDIKTLNLYLKRELLGTLSNLKSDKIYGSTKLNLVSNDSLTGFKPYIENETLLNIINNKGRKLDILIPDKDYMFKVLKFYKDTLPIAKKDGLYLDYDMFSDIKKAKKSGIIFYGYIFNGFRTENKQSSINLTFKEKTNLIINGVINDRVDLLVASSVENNIFSNKYIGVFLEKRYYTNRLYEIIELGYFIKNKDKLYIPPKILNDAKGNIFKPLVSSNCIVDRLFDDSKPSYTDRPENSVSWLFLDSNPIVNKLYIPMPIKKVGYNLKLRNHPIDDILLYIVPNSIRNNKGDIWFNILRSGEYLDKLYVQEDYPNLKPSPNTYIGMGDILTINDKLEELLYINRRVNNLDLNSIMLDFNRVELIYQNLYIHSDYVKIDKLMNHIILSNKDDNYNKMYNSFGFDHYYGIIDLDYNFKKDTKIYDIFSDFGNMYKIGGNIGIEASIYSHKDFDHTHNIITLGNIFISDTKIYDIQKIVEPTHSLIMRNDIYTGIFKDIEFKPEYHTLSLNNDNFNSLLYFNEYKKIGNEVLLKYDDREKIYTHNISVPDVSLNDVRIELYSDLYKKQVHMYHKTIDVKLNSIQVIYKNDSRVIPIKSIDVKYIVDSNRLYKNTAIEIDINALRISLDGQPFRDTINLTKLYSNSVVEIDINALKRNLTTSYRNKNGMYVNRFYENSIIEIDINALRLNLNGQPFDINSVNMTKLYRNSVIEIDINSLKRDLNSEIVDKFGRYINRVVPIINLFTTPGFKQNKDVSYKVQFDKFEVNMDTYNGISLKKNNGYNNTEFNTPDYRYVDNFYNTNRYIISDNGTVFSYDYHIKPLLEFKYYNLDDNRGGLLVFNDYKSIMYQDVLYRHSRDIFKFTLNDYKTTDIRVDYKHYSINWEYLTNSYNRTILLNDKIYSSSIYGLVKDISYNYKCTISDYIGNNRIYDTKTYDTRGLSYNSKDTVDDVIYKNGFCNGAKSFSYYTMYGNTQSSPIKTLSGYELSTSYTYNEKYTIDGKVYNTLSYEVPDSYAYTTKYSIKEIELPGSEPSYSRSDISPLLTIKHQIDRVFNKSKFVVNVMSPTLDDYKLSSVTKIYDITSYERSDIDYAPIVKYKMNIPLYSSKPLCKKGTHYDIKSAVFNAPTMYINNFRTLFELHHIKHYSEYLEYLERVKSGNMACLCNLSIPEFSPNKLEVKQIVLKENTAGKFRIRGPYRYEGWYKDIKVYVADKDPITYAWDRRYETGLLQKDTYTSEKSDKVVLTPLKGSSVYDQVTHFVTRGIYSNRYQLDGTWDNELIKDEMYYIKKLYPNKPYDSSIELNSSDLFTSKKDAYDYIEKYKKDHKLDNEVVEYQFRVETLEYKNSGDSYRLAAPINMSVRGPIKPAQDVPTYAYTTVLPEDMWISRTAIVYEKESDRTSLFSNKFFLQ